MIRSTASWAPRARKPLTISLQSRASWSRRKPPSSRLHLLLWPGGGNLPALRRALRQPHRRSGLPRSVRRSDRRPRGALCLAGSVRDLAHEIVAPRRIHPRCSYDQRGPRRGGLARRPRVCFGRTRTTGPGYRSRTMAFGRHHRRHSPMKNEGVGCPVRRPNAPLFPGRRHSRSRTMAGSASALSTAV